MLTLCHNYFRVTSNNKSPKDDVQNFSKRKFAFGLFILFLVSVLWVVSSELTKYIYIEKKLERPFLVTYVRSSLLFVYLLVLCFTPPTRDPCQPADYTQLTEPTAETDDENFYTEANNSLGDSTFIPVRAGETTDSDDATPRAVRFNKVAEVRVMSAAMAGEALLARLSWSASMRATEYAQRRAAAAATRRHLKLALVFSLPWFVSNYLYRLSLLHTTTCSATLYTSVTGAFALSIGAIFAQVPYDRFSLSKFVAILLTTAGLVVLGVTESHQSNWTAVLAALGSALCYAAHLIIFRQEMRKGDGINSFLLVGVVGCACGCLAWAFGGLLALGGVEKAELPSPRLWSWLLLDGAIGPLLIESLWLWGRWLTSSQTATATLALTLPLSACAEAWRGAGSTWRTAACILAAAGWLTSAMPEPLAWLTAKLRAADGFTAIRNISELDEQSEALMSSDEPT
ncbi:solute carrier family 35 member F5 isoform X2 [Maniola hyperantus]|uniref:solute carrier family 35 member F5 isoform X2 n=1 Tax=Aphantopus hyperantus TaxID=2795564 RepID=UPI00156955F4|nr:solute carrier family 35 member F5 isoform X2 [Maniola hyperantus]